MIEITATMTTQTVELKDNTLRAMVKYMDGMHLQFERGIIKLHRKTVFEILILLIRYTPVLTGRLRGSWTPYLDRYGKQAAYAKYLNDKSLVIYKKASTAKRLVMAVKKRLGLDEITAGKLEGFFTESALVTTVGSNVAYAASVNAQSKYFDRASQAATFIINDNYEQYIKAAQKEGWIPTDYPDDPQPPRI